MDYWLEMITPFTPPITAWQPTFEMIAPFACMTMNNSMRGEISIEEKLRAHIGFAKLWRQQLEWCLKAMSN